MGVSRVKNEIHEAKYAELPDDRQAENIVEFLKKKNSIKREYDLQEKKKERKRRKRG